MYERPRVKCKLSEVQLLRSRVTFHTFIYERKIYATVEINLKMYTLLGILV